ncbi:GAF domain-containing protein [Komarekiella sp. 'clone 1']|uniref:histidine kinase n=1 Tax=Komarekiella delphini-convector SJRDD-AB1 TaxID=2593771 RepID=A0AA40SX87_9NOST|nr:GAF domain-containing protein [Komarekiella delphini-convector SJRDD-AB1]
MDETLKSLHTSNCQQDSINLLSRVAVNLPGMIFQVLQRRDGSPFVLYVSSGCQDLFELEPEVIQVDFQGLLKLIHPQDIKILTESISASVNIFSPWRWEGRIITPSGMKWIQCTCQPQRQANGDCLWDGLVMDITDQKQAEEKLRESEARYKAILDAIPDLIFRISRDGKYLDLKSEGANITLSKEEIVGKNLWELLPRDVAAITQEAIAKTLDSGTLQTYEYQLPTPLGVRDYEARLVVSAPDEVLAIVRDITQRKQVEAQLHLSAQRDRLLTESLARIRSSLKLDQILQTTVTEVRQFLQADRVFIGINNAKLKGRTIAESVDPNYPSVSGWSTNDEAYLQELQNLLKTNLVRVIEDIRQTTISPKVKAHFQKFKTRASLTVPIMLGDKLFGALIANQCSGPRNWQPMEIDLLQQMSEQVAIAIQQSLIHQELAELNTNLEHQVQERTAQLQQKMQEIEELHRVKDVVLHTVAHDLRTSVMGNLMVLQNLLKRGLGNGDWGLGNSGPPLGIRGNGDWVLGKESAQSLIPVSSSIIERMIQGNDRQLKMIDSLLEIHSCEKEGISIKREPVQFSTLMEGVIADLEPILRQNQATLKNLIPKDLPLVMADANRLQKVLASLLTHSLQHNPPGLNFTMKATFEAGIIRTQIQHNGMAMSKLECDRLFDLYVRDPQDCCSTSIGLKMYLCRKVIKAHGGEIGVTTNHKRGLAFWFTLPVN